MMNSKKISLGIISFFCLILLLNVSTPFLYKSLPNDYTRTKIILDSLKDPHFKPSIVVFGNSKAMMGVNCSILDKEIVGARSNSLTSVGQPLLESTLYYTKLPGSVHKVVQCLLLASFKDHGKPTIPSTAELALYMFGYQVDDETNKLLSPYIDDLTDQSYLVNNFKSRSCLKAGLSIIIRDKMDSDASDKEVNSLTFPYLYPSNRTQDNYNRGINRINSKENPFEKAQVNTEYIAFLCRLNHYFEKKNIDYYIVLMPENLDLTYTHDPKTLAFLKSIKKEFPGNIHLIDCFDDLEPEEFYDVQHPNRIGAEKISKIIAKQINLNEIISTKEIKRKKL